LFHETIIYSFAEVPVGTSIITGAVL